jgi:hypothetical protein
MPIQRTLSPVPPLGKKSHHHQIGQVVSTKKAFTDFDVPLPFSSMSTPNGLTATAIVTPPSPLHTDASILAMNGIIDNFRTFVFGEDSDDDESTTEKDKPTDHKLLCDSGAVRPEPLLVSNPRRFVLFPIQDNEVSGRVSMLFFSLFTL